MQYSFSLYNKLAPTGIFMALDTLLLKEPAPPVVLCIGSDLVIGDSLGPVTGTLIKKKCEGLPVFVYGDLTSPITAKEISYVRAFLKNTHPKSRIIAVDAAIGEDRDTGLIKINQEPLKPGSGANKNLGKIGDISILGVIAEKSLFNYSVLERTRLNVVYKMSEIVAEGVSELLYKKYSDGLCAVK